MSNLIEILSVRAELFYADGRTDGQTARWTDMTNLIVAFRNFANAPKKYWILVQLEV
jgi:Fe-S-cluster formation regulator IscX/YfhJ